MDVHYTPAFIAKALVRATPELQPELVADLAAGNGDLLLHAEEAWPSARFVATDIDRRAVSRLARLRPSWSIGRCDLRNARSRASCRVLRDIEHATSLMLLNPPFSCRGGRRFVVQTSAGTVQAGTAMSFLLLATRYVAKTGHVVSVLPQGCLYNSKDAQAWSHLRSRFDVDVVDSYSKGSFPGSAANTAVVHLSPRTRQMRHTSSSRSVRREQDSAIHVVVVRGNCPVHRPGHESLELPLVHYTDIRNGSVVLNGRRGFGAFRCVDGPAVLIPRVGRLTSGKIALLKSSDSVMLSDCVIALRPVSLEHARSLCTRLVENLDQLRNHYVGTGAPFVTLARLNAALRALGVHVDESR